MNIVCEPDFKWGGTWTNTKLDAFENYVNAYLTIMNAQKKIFNGWPETIYFDGFAGSGTILPPFNNTDHFLLNYYNMNDLKVYRGSAERVLSLTQKFNYYYFIDIDKQSLEELKQTLSGKNLINKNCEFICGDVNNYIRVFSEKLDAKKAALILLDPFGMQLNWSSIELLRNKRVDLWILVPSGVIINRLLDRKGELKSINKLEKYFGIQEHEIKMKFYKVKETQTLFGKENIIFKVNNSINRIAELYVDRLKQIFEFVTDKPLVMFNSKNVPIYHFIFASNNKTALKIASQIIEKKRK